MSISAVSTGDQFFEAGGVRFHYQVRGSGPLLIVPNVGWGAPLATVQFVLGDHLEESFTVLYFEPRGTGQSSRPSDPTTMTAKTTVEDLERLREHLGIEAFPVLFGGSHSGAISLRYAEIYPTRVAKLVLTSCQIMDSPPNNHMQTQFAKRKDDPNYAAAAAKLMELMTSPTPPATDAEFGAAMDVLMPWYFSDVSNVAPLREALAKSAALPSAFALQTNANDSKPENKLPHVAEAGKVEAKTLIIRGGEDPMCSPGGSQALADGIRGSTFVTIPGVGHFPWLEAPDAVWAALDSFLKA